MIIGKTGHIGIKFSSERFISKFFLIATDCEAIEKAESYSFTG